MKKLIQQFRRLVRQPSSENWAIYCRDVNLGGSDTRNWLRYDIPTFQRLRLPVRTHVLGVGRTH